MRDNVIAGAVLALADTAISFSLHIFISKKILFSATQTQKSQKIAKKITTASGKKTYGE